MIGSLQILLYSSQWRKSRATYIIIDNYRPILVNSITGKKFERMIYNINQLFANL